ncbi:hypothetical protein LINGRAHAP2_LOCUS17470 [Linum grandiflorum]
MRGHFYPYLPRN